MKIVTTWQTNVLVVRLHHDIIACRTAAENQLLQPIEPVYQSVLIGHQLKVALVQAEYQLILLQLMTGYRSCHNMHSNASEYNLHSTQYKPPLISGFLLRMS